MNRRAMLSGAAALALAACGKNADNAASGPPKVLNFSILAVESATSVEVVWKPVLADMEKAIGIPVKPIYAQNYTARKEAVGGIEAAKAAVTRERRIAKVVDGLRG